VLKQMRKLRTEGVSYRQIAARLDEQPVPPRSGRVFRMNCTCDPFSGTLHLGDEQGQGR